MRAELSVSYRRGDAHALLVTLFGPHTPTTLRKSALAHKSPESARSIVYASVIKPGVALLASNSGKTVELYVESSGGRLREGAESVWAKIRDNGKAIKPKLLRLVLVDEDANDVLATASAAAGKHLRRDDLFLPIATGVVTAVVLAGAEILGRVSADFVYGSATALAVAILSLGRLLWSSRSKDLVWR
jgi:hypothetical protein